MGNDDRHCHIFHISPTSVLVDIVADHDLVHYLRLSGHQKPLVMKFRACGQKACGKNTISPNGPSMFLLGASRHNGAIIHRGSPAARPPIAAPSYFLTDIRICTGLSISSAEMNKFLLQAGVDSPSIDRA